MKTKYLKLKFARETYSPQDAQRAAMSVDDMLHHLQQIKAANGGNGDIPIILADDYMFSPLRRITKVVTSKEQ